MRFYVVETEGGETLGCELSLKAAHATATKYGYTRREYTVDLVQCAANAETIRRLLGQLGGYANETKQVHP